MFLKKITKAKTGHHHQKDRNGKRDKCDDLNKKNHSFLKKFVYRNKFDEY